MTADTKYRIHSITKTYTAVMIFQFVEEGKLKLSDTLDKFFPGFPFYGAKITVRQLLTHTSGVPDYEPLVPPGTTLQLRDLETFQPDPKP